MLKANIMRRVRGAIGNAAVWGACWAGLTTVTLTTLKLVGAFGQELIWLDIIGMAIKIGIFGGFASGAFSLLLPLIFRRKRLSEISWVRFGLLGGVVMGVFVPLFMQSMNVVFGDGPIARNLIDTHLILSTVFGAVTAGGSLRLAQYAERKLPGESAAQFEAADNMNALSSGDEGELESSLLPRNDVGIGARSL